MNTIIEILSTIFLGIGVIVLFSAALGLYRFQDIYMRLHSSTKVNTGGAMALFLGIILRIGFNGFLTKLLIIIALIFVVTPVISHAIARSAHLQQKTPMVSIVTYIDKNKPPKKGDFDD